MIPKHIRTYAHKRYYIEEAKSSSQVSYLWRGTKWHFVKSTMVTIHSASLKRIGTDCMPEWRSLSFEIRQLASNTISTTIISMTLGKLLISSQSFFIWKMGVTDLPQRGCRRGKQEFCCLKKKHTQKKLAYNLVYEYTLRNWWVFFHLKTAISDSFGICCLCTRNNVRDINAGALYDGKEQDMT